MPSTMLLLAILCWWILSLPKWTIHVETCSRSYLFRYRTTQRDGEKLARNSESGAKSTKLGEDPMGNDDGLSRKESLEPYKNGGDNKQDGKKGNTTQEENTIKKGTEPRTDRQHRTDDEFAEKCRGKTLELQRVISSLLLQLVAQRTLENTVIQAFAWLGVQSLA